jgi:hypothetical protein
METTKPTRKEVSTHDANAGVDEDIADASVHVSNADRDGNGYPLEMAMSKSSCMRPLIALSARVHLVGLAAGSPSALRLLFVEITKKKGKRTRDQTWILQP